MLRVESINGPGNYFKLPLTEPRGSFEVRIDQAVKNVLFEGIEDTLDYAGNLNLYEEASFQVQLEYALALAKVGEAERSNGQFENALAANETKGAYLHRRLLSSSIADSEFKREQAQAYSETAVKLYDAGFLEKAHEIALKADVVLQEARAAKDVDTNSGMREDLFRHHREPIAALVVARNLALVGRTDEAQAIQYSIPVNGSTYEGHLEVLEARKQKLLEFGETAEAEECLDMQKEIVKGGEAYLLGLDEETGSLHLADRGAEKLISLAGKYDLPIDMDSIFEHLVELIKEAKEDVQAKIFLLTRIVWAFHDSTNKDTHREVLSDLLLNLQLKKINNPDSGSEDDETIEDIIFAYARIGENEHVEALVHDVPLRYRLGIRIDQVNLALKSQDMELAKELLDIATEELKARFKERSAREIDESDFKSALEIAHAHIKVGNLDQMDAIYQMLIDYDDETLGYENARDNKTIAEGYMLMGDIVKAFNAIKRSEDPHQAEFLVGLLLNGQKYIEPFDLIGQKVLFDELARFVEYRKSLRED